MKIKINNQEYEARAGETIYQVCQKNRIKIPTLCSLKDFHEGLCRICVVEQNGKLITSCNKQVSDGMEIATESEEVSRARRINLELLWSDHAGKCVTCKKNRKCELQDLAEEYKIENFHFVPRKEELTIGEELDLLKDNRLRVVVDEGNPAISRTTELCVECRRCINVCPTKEFGFNNRAGDVVVGTPYEKPLDCIFCGQCVKDCPVGAITDKNDLPKIIGELDDLKKMAVALVDPAILESVAFEQEEMDSKEKIVGVLQAIGFEKVFDLGFGMELMLEQMEKKIKDSPGKNIILGHCPSLNLYIQKYYPQFVENILNVANPDEIMAEHIKRDYAREQKINPDDIAVISISSCTANKVSKSENLDYVITVRELGRIIRQKNIKLADIKQTDFNNELVRSLAPPGAKLLLNGKSAKNIIRTGGAAEILAKKTKAKYVVADGIEQIKNILNNLSKSRIETKIIEGMVCPGGCVNGGGQSRNFKF